ncbi:MAG: hypothetical protein HYR56_30715 [Acidobacteria bacterium]|nr:hypothetical protein [Acidobacteriota bacterium]MBI3422442.1 hypothetical protein [Acidobacteriota bacterium]
MFYRYTNRFLGGSVILWVALSAALTNNLLPRLHAQEAQAPPVIISTVAGGGLSANAQARQAPMELPHALVFDPPGRGFYVVDDVDGTSLLRFVNTSPTPVTLAGTTVLPGNINLIAGGGVRIEDGTPARDADLAKVTGLAADPTGNALLLALPAFNAIRVVNVGAQNYLLGGRSFAPGTIGTLAAPEFADLRGVVIHPLSREVFFIAGSAVYRIDNAGEITPIAGGGAPPTGNGDGGPARQARLVNPRGLAFDAGNTLLIAEGGNPRSSNPDGAVRRVSGTNTISTVAGGLEFPTGVTAAPNGNIYAALGNAQQIIGIAPTGTRTLVAGNSSLLACDPNANPTCGDGRRATDAALNLPDSAANETLVFAAENRGIFLPDYRFGRVRFINLSGAGAQILGTTINPLQINTIAGSGLEAPYDGLLATSAELSEPAGVTVDPQGNLYIADTRTNRLRFVNRGTQPVTLFIASPAAVTVQPGQIVTLNNGAGEPQLDDRITNATFSSPQGLLATDKGVFIVDSQAGALIKIPPNSVSGRRSGVLRFLNTSSQAVTFFPNGGDARVIVPPGQVKDLAGVRPPANPQILGDGLTANRVAIFMTDLALDSAGTLLLTDQANNRIRRIDASEGVVRTAYGDGQAATLNRPTGIALDGTGRLLIADTRNNRILRQDAGATTFAVIADETKNIRTPRDLAVDNTGRILITNAGTHQVLELLAPAQQLGTTRVLAGNGTAGFSGDDGPGAQARLNFPPIGTSNNDIQLTANLVALSNGEVLFTDTGNHRIRLLKPGARPLVTNLSAASYLGAEVASDSMIAAFGANLATRAESATSLPLPTALAGTYVKVRDSAGLERDAALFFVSPGQVNYLVPAGTQNGLATVTVTSGDGTISVGTLTVATVAPGLFTANANGSGVAAAVLLRIKADNSQSFELISRFDTAQNVYVPIPVDLGPETDRVFVLLFGTGIRLRSSLNAVQARIGEAPAEINFAGPAGDLAGLDQVNARIPRSLIGRGLVNIVLTVDGKTANTVTMQIK